MPIYDFHCPNCSIDLTNINIPYAEREIQRCPNCSGLLNPLPTAPGVRVFKRGWYEHIGADPIYIDSARDLEQACKENNAISPYLEDSPYRRHLK